MTSHKRKFYIYSGTEKHILLGNDINEALQAFCEKVALKMEFKQIALGDKIRISERGFDITFQEANVADIEARLINTDDVLKAFNIKEKFEKI